MFCCFLNQKWLQLHRKHIYFYPFLFFVTSDLCNLCCNGIVYRFDRLSFYFPKNRWKRAKYAHFFRSNLVICSHKNQEKINSDGIRRKTRKNALKTCSIASEIIGKFSIAIWPNPQHPQPIKPQPAPTNYVNLCVDFHFWCIFKCIAEL